MESSSRVPRVAPEARWLDGLPTIEPDEGLMADVLRHLVTRPGGADVLGKMPPSYKEVRLLDVARAIAMSGAEPRTVAVLKAAVEACLDPAFNLLAVTSTTEAVAPLMIINGPSRHALQINTGANLFGPGCRANATLGRALRLLLIEVGGAVPGQTEMSTHGHPGKYTYCIGEAEEESPWEPFHMELGFDRRQSTVTLVAAESPQDVIDLESAHPQDLLWSIARALSVPSSHNAIVGGQTLVILSPEHARVLNKAGLSRSDIRAYLFEHASIAISEFSPATAARLRRQRRLDEAASRVHPVNAPADILLMVAGGVGRHTAVVRTFGASRAVTRLFG
jgi:hypothetical protein